MDSKQISQESEQCCTSPASKGVKTIRRHYCQQFKTVQAKCVGPLAAATITRQVSEQQQPERPEALPSRFPGSWSCMAAGSVGPMPPPKTWSVLVLPETGLQKSSHMSRYHEHALFIPLFLLLALGFFVRTSVADAINDILYQSCSTLCQHLAGHATLATPGKTLSGMMLWDVA